MNEIITNGFAKRIADMVHDPLSSNKVMPSFGTIINFYHDNNTADITVSINGEEKVMQGVTIVNNNPTNKTCFIFKDPVLVIFLFGDPDKPVILGKLDEQYFCNTREAMRRNIITI